jgi:tetratricopeptide (TPR) repeat protein
MNNLALAYGDTGQQTDKSLSLFEQVFQKHKARLGPDHAETLRSMNNLAQAYRHFGQLARAIPLFEQVLRKREATLGPDHLDTLFSLGGLAETYLAAGQVDKALPLCEQAQAKMTAKLGPGHPEALRTAYNLGQAYGVTGQTDKALALLEPALQTARVALGSDHPDTLTCMALLGVAHRRKGQTDKALPLLEQALAGMKRAQSRLDFTTAYAFVIHLAALHEERGELDQAAALFAEWVALCRKRGPGHPGLAPLVLEFGRVLTRQKKYAEAEPLLLEAYEVLKPRDGQAFGPAEQVQDAMERLLDLYAAWERKDKVMHWLWNLSRFHCDRGVDLMTQGKPADAEAAFRKAVSLIGSTPGNRGGPEKRVRRPTGVLHVIHIAQSYDQKADFLVFEGPRTPPRLPGVLPPCSLGRGGG